MKYGIREICDVVFKAKGVQKVGNRIFYKDEPVMYFDTLKTSSLEAASATVYAQGGRGNPRLIAWDGDRTLTFNMEDALISSEGLQILSGAGLMEASTKDTVKVHSTSQLGGNDVIVTVADSKVTGVDIYLPVKPYWPMANDAYVYDSSDRSKNTNFIYVFPLDEYGEVWTEPFIPNMSASDAGQASLFAEKNEIIAATIYNALSSAEKNNYTAVVPTTEPATYKRTAESGWRKAVVDGGEKAIGYKLSLVASDDLNNTSFATNGAPVFGDDIAKIFSTLQGENVVLVDYYTEKTSGVQQIDITADKFGGSFYIEADTLFRTQQGLDMPAEFIIPNGKIQSNFTFSMAATGDPSTFTFTVDAMPDYTRFDKTKKVLAAIQIIQDAATSEASRERTYTAAPGVDVNYL
jgi:hypothetical protein